MRTLWLLPIIALLAIAPGAGAAMPAPPGCFPMTGSQCTQPGSGSFAAPKQWCAWGVCYTRSAGEVHTESFQVDQIGNLQLAGGWYRRIDTNQQGQTSTLGCGTIFYPPAQPYGYAPCVPVSGYFVTHQWSLYHKYRTDRPYSMGTIATFRALDGLETQKSANSISALSDPSANTPQCSSYETHDASGAPAPLPTAPAEIIPICWPGYVAPGPLVDTDGDGVVECTLPGAIISSADVECITARNVARFVRRNGKAPKKWRCTRIVKVGSDKLTRCTNIATSAKKVNVRWRVRS